MRLQKESYSEGYLTVYLVLVMTVMLSLYLTLIEGARSNAIRLEAECVTDIGLNSALAEYHRELYRQYNLFAIDTSYGTFRSGSDNLEEHLTHYVDRNLSMEDIFLENFLYRDFWAMSVKDINVTSVSILADNGGEVFRTRAIEAVKDDIGITLMEQLTEWTRTVTNKELLQRNVADEKEAVDSEIEAYDGMEKQISEEEWIIVDVDNPTQGLNEIRKKGILNSVIGEQEQLSVKAIDTDALIGTRMELGQISVGNYASDEQQNQSEWEERFFFQEYLLKYMGRYGYTDEENALLYQIEYLLFAEESDMENLRNTANRLCAMREVSNVLYIYSDEVKCAEAELLATVIATACGVPEIASLLKHTLLLGWAYAESLYDVKTLLAGGKVPLLKNESTWHYDLGTALQMGGEQKAETIGLAYEDYLRILLSFTDLDTLTVRAMNMVEADIRQTPGNAYFRLDSCYDCIEAEVFIESAYGYRCEITRQKKYR